MKILILGATGRTGKLVLQQALTTNHTIHVLVRDKSKISEDARISVFEGNPSDTEILSIAAEECDAIVSVLNISRTSDFPWAKLRTPKTFLSDVMQNIIAVSKEQGIKRVIVCSAWGVSETGSDIPFWFRWLIYTSNIGVAYKDHEQQEKLITATDLDWTVVRPVVLTNASKLQKIQISYKNVPHPKMTISRKTVATFMVNAIEDKTLIRKFPVISAY